MGEDLHAVEEGLGAHFPSLGKRSAYVEFIMGV